MYHLSERLDEIGKPAWIGLTILSFILWWPLGLVVLSYLVGSGRMACWTRSSSGRWQQRVGRVQSAAQWWGCGSSARRNATGNYAFDEYRAETLRRLEDEQREFIDFLDRLRHAKDKAEFDEFMAERRRHQGPAPQPQEI